MAVQGCGVSEGVHDDLAGDSRVRGEVEEVAGVVIDPPNDLDFFAGREAVVCEVRLRHFVGLCGLEPDPGRTRTFLGLRGDHGCVGEDAPDRGARHVNVFSGQVLVNAVRASVTARAEEFVAELKNACPYVVRDARRRSAGCPGAWLKRGVALSEPPLVESMDEGLGDAVTVRGFPVRESLDGDRGDEELIAVHCPLCPETYKRGKREVSRMS